MTFDIHVTVHRDNFLIIKPTRCTNFSNLFWNETLHVSGSSSVHHQQFFTVHAAMDYVIQVCWQLEDVPSWSCSQSPRKSVWNIPLLCVQWKTPDDGQRNCPKEFHSKNKFEKLVHLVGFIIRKLKLIFDHLCGLVVRVSGYRYRGLGFDSRRYQIFWIEVGLERGPFSLARSNEELLE